MARARDQRLAAERDRRLLLAYAREFTDPRPYRLEDLARAAGMSVSGVRTAYDHDEITAINGTTTPVHPAWAGHPLSRLYCARCVTCHGQTGPCNPTTTSANRPFTP